MRPQCRLLIAFISIAAGSIGGLHAQSRLSPETQAACAREFASSRLDVLRSKFPVSLGESASDEMRKNGARPNQIERTALKAYVAATMACNRLAFIEIYPGNVNAQRDAENRLVKPNAEQYGDLIDGKISYAEYFRRDDARVAASMAEYEAKERQVRYQRHVEKWLNPFREKYQTSPAWLAFYNAAILIAIEVDTGKISEQDAQQRIDERRLRFNEELAAENAPTPLVLNCALSGSNGLRMDRPVHVDFSRKLVNGYSAEILESEIRWSHKSDDGQATYRYRINRLSGFSTVGTDQFPALLNGYCSQANAKF